jgi:hypothetical protein
MRKNIIAQAALVILGLAIRGYDYLRTRKQGKTAGKREIAEFKLK